MKAKLLTSRGAAYFSIITLLIYGGFGFHQFRVKSLGIIFGTMALSWVICKKRKLELPTGFFYYVIFLAVLLISNTWSVNRVRSWEGFLLFLSGGLFWLLAFNTKNTISSIYLYLLVVLGIFFGILYFINIFTVNLEMGTFSLFLEKSKNATHNSIGDLWVVTLLTVIFYRKRLAKIVYYLLITVGLYFLAISLSRAAYVSLMAGIGLLFFRNKKLKSKGTLNFLIGFIVVLSLFFIRAGIYKTTIFSRQHYIQAIAGFVQNPFGVGLGNFRTISIQPENHLFSFDSYSIFADNLVLEMVSAIGIFSILFIIWFIVILREMWKNKKREKEVFVIVSFALAMNFMFYNTYFIPTMLWLWFITLGLAQDKSVKVIEI